MEMKTIKQKFETIATEYLNAFCKKQDMEFEFWVGDEIGGVASFGDVNFFSFDNIRQDIDLNAPVGLILDWLYDCLEHQSTSCNYYSYINGLRHNTSPDSMLVRRSSSPIDYSVNNQKSRDDISIFVPFPWDSAITSESREADRGKEKEILEKSAMSWRKEACQYAEESSRLKAENEKLRELAGLQYERANFIAENHNSMTIDDTKYVIGLTYRISELRSELGLG